MFKHSNEIHCCCIRPNNTRTCCCSCSILLGSVARCIRANSSTMYCSPVTEHQQSFSRTYWGLPFCFMWDSISADFSAATFSACSGIWAIRATLSPKLLWATPDCSLYRNVTLEHDEASIDNDEIRLYRCVGRTLPDNQNIRTHDVLRVK